MQDLKTDLRKEIEALLQRHPGGLTAAQLAERTQADIGIVRSIVGRLRDKLLIHATRPGNSQTAYRWQTEPPMTTPPNRINKMDGRYIEARDNPPAPRRPGSDQHEQYGSRMGNVITYRDKTISHVQ